MPNPTTIRLSTSALALLRKMAKKERRTMAEIIRIALEEYAVKSSDSRTPTA